MKMTQIFVTGKERSIRRSALMVLLPSRALALAVLVASSSLVLLSLRQATVIPQAPELNYEPISLSRSNSTTTTAKSSSDDPTQLFGGDDARLIEWRRRRYNSTEIQNGWFAPLNGVTKPDADVDGPVLDFAIVGFPKCGTSGMMRTLSAVASMPPELDVCTPPGNAVYYAYRNWPKQFDPEGTKLLKGTKCPYYIEGPDLDTFGRNLPKTRLIVGIRHPVQWFQSFLNMVSYTRTVLPHCFAQLLISIRSSLLPNSNISTLPDATDTTSPSSFPINFSSLRRTTMSALENPRFVSLDRGSTWVWPA